MVRSALLLAAALLAHKSSAAAPGLTVRAGETWIFTIENGQPAGARKVEAATGPGTGEVQVSVRHALGTAMSMGGKLSTAYAYRAELIHAGKVVEGRACTLPANGRPVFEYWPQRVDAVRISDFKPSRDARCR